MSDGLILDDVHWFVSLVEELPYLLQERHPSLNLSALPPPLFPIHLDQRARLNKRACPTSTHTTTSSNSDNSTNNNPNPNPSSSKSSNTTTLIGAVVGAVGGVVFLAVVCFFFYRRHKQRQTAKLQHLIANPNPNGNTGAAIGMPTGPAPSMKFAGYANPVGVFPNMNSSSAALGQPAPSSGYTPSTGGSSVYYGATEPHAASTMPDWLSGTQPNNNPNPGFFQYPAPTFAPGNTSIPPPFSPPLPENSTHSSTPWAVPASGPSSSYAETSVSIPQGSEKAHYSGYVPATPAPAWHPDMKYPTPSASGSATPAPPVLPPYSLQ